ncbi:cytochrome P450, partial [Diaporthe sp. PMI_573]
VPLLQAIIWEGLRMSPPFSGLIMKQVGPEGDSFDGHFIPPGTRVGHSTWAVTHDKTAFGPDANTFRPERWIEMSG